MSIVYCTIDNICMINRYIYPMYINEFFILPKVLNIVFICIYIYTIYYIVSL